MSKDNTVGSQESLSKDQEEILVGLMLGDGCLELQHKNPRLRVDHSMKQKDYIEWLYSQFKDFCNQRPHQLNRVDKRNGRIYDHYLLTTRTSLAFRKYFNMFYAEKKKTIPKNLMDLLKSKLTLAVWYMDDGFKRGDCSSLYLCTSGFKLEDQKFLQEILEKLYGFKTKIHFASKNARIYFPVQFAKEFCNLVRPFILPQFTYKLL
ncbi:hypothetical protein HYU95_03440 [Candidatus Daviesbacteria bacterium]|nr:hypothetical protein [Candidatus Daviesbacteria bacterium]